MMTCRAYGFTTGLMHSGNAFISIWPHTPTSSPPLTQWHTWERNIATPRTPTSMTRATCATAFSADTSTPRASTLLSSACALALWVLTFFRRFNQATLTGLHTFSHFNGFHPCMSPITRSSSEVCRSVTRASVTGLMSLRWRACRLASQCLCLVMLWLHSAVWAPGWCMVPLPKCSWARHIVTSDQL